MPERCGQTELREGLDEPKAISSPLIEAAGSPRRGTASAWNRFRRHRLAMGGLIFLLAVVLSPYSRQCQFRRSVTRASCAWCASPRRQDMARHRRGRAGCLGAARLCLAHLAHGRHRLDGARHRHRGRAWAGWPVFAGAEIDSADHAFHRHHSLLSDPAGDPVGRHRGRTVEHERDPGDRRVHLAGHLPARARAIPLVAPPGVCRRRAFAGAHSSRIVVSGICCRT